MKRPSEVMEKYGFEADKSIVYSFWKGYWFDVSVGDDTEVELDNEKARSREFIKEMVSSENGQNYTKFSERFHKKVNLYRKDEARRQRKPHYVPFDYNSDKAREILIQTEKELWDESSIKRE